METISTLVVTIATIISLFYYKKFINTPYVYFIYYLTYTLFTEVMGVLFGHILLIYNVFIYNIYTIVTFIFYFLFFRLLFKSNKLKKLMVAFLLSYILFIFLDLLVLKPNFFKNSYTHIFVFGSILLISTLILFLIEIINNKFAIFKYKETLIFWICIGTLLFFIGVLPVMISVEYLKYEGLYDIVVATLNIIMYGSFSYGFINSNPKYNY